MTGSSNQETNNHLENIFGTHAPLGILRPLLQDLSRLHFIGFVAPEDINDTTGHTEFVSDDVTEFYSCPEVFCRWIAERERENQMVVISSRLGKKGLFILPMIDLVGRPDPYEIEVAMRRLGEAYSCPVHLFDSGASYHIYLEKVLTDENRNIGEQSVVASFQAMGQLLCTQGSSSIADPAWIAHQILRNGDRGLRINLKNGRYPRHIKTVRPRVASEHDTFDVIRPASEMLDWAARVIEPLGCRSLIACGGVLASDFQAGVDDVDLTIVHEDKDADNFRDLVEVAERLSPYGYDTTLISFDELSAVEPNIYQVSLDSFRTLHPIEIHELKNRSRVIAGEDVRGEFRNIPWRQAVEISMTHRLQSLMEMNVSGMSSSPERVESLRRYAYSLLRDLAMLTCNNHLSKKASLAWLLNYPNPSQNLLKLQHAASRLTAPHKGESFQLEDLRELFVLVIRELYILMVGDANGLEDQPLNEVIKLALTDLRAKQ